MRATLAPYMVPLFFLAWICKVNESEIKVANSFSISETRSVKVDRPMFLVRPPDKPFHKSLCLEHLVAEYLRSPS